MAVRCARDLDFCGAEKAPAGNIETSVDGGLLARVEDGGVVDGISPRKDDARVVPSEAEPRRLQRLRLDRPRQLPSVAHGEQPHAETPGKRQRILGHEDLRPANVHLVHFWEAKERAALGEVIEDTAASELDLDALADAVPDGKEVESVPGADGNFALERIARIAKSLLHEVHELPFVSEHGSDYYSEWHPSPAAQMPRVQDLHAQGRFTAIGARFGKRSPTFGLRESARNFSTPSL